MKRVSNLLIAVCLSAWVASSSLAQSTEKGLSLSFESPTLIQQGNVTVTLADFVAFVDWRVPRAERSSVLRSPARIEGLLESIVLTEAFLEQLKEAGNLNTPIIQARLYQSVARQARSLFREQLETELELSSYETQAREIYMLEPERFLSRQSVDLEHILIAIEEEQDVVSAMREALEAYDALLSGEPFSDVASRHSDDEGFDEHGGVFEALSLDSLVPAVSKVAETLEIGQYSAPVRSQYGWHVFRITARTEADQLTWEEAQPIAEELARERHLSKAYQRRLREINSAPMQFAEGAIETILDHYGLPGFDAPVPVSDDETPSN